MPRRFWTCTIITTISALVSAGFSVVGLLAPSSSDSFARYAASPSIALLIAVLFCLGGSLARGDCCSGARHDFGPRVRWHHRYSRTRPGENLRPVCFCPRERRWACVAAAPTERVGEKVFYGRHLFAAKPKVNSEHVYGDHEPSPELVSEVECSAACPQATNAARTERALIGFCARRLSKRCA
jgi:hypothetical protein